MKIDRQELEGMAKKALQDAIDSAKNSNGFVEVEAAEGFGVYGKKQMFALFGPTAYQMAVFESEEAIMFPAIIDGKIWGQFPEEGKSGCLHVFYHKQKQRWACCWTHWGWLHSNELRLSPGEINNKLAEEAFNKSFWFGLTHD